MIWPVLDYDAIKGVEIVAEPANKIGRTEDLREE